MNHSWILQNLAWPHGLRDILKRILETHGVPNPSSDSEEPIGIPQGGLLSPLLFNIALDGLENEVKAIGGFRRVHREKLKKIGPGPTDRKPKLNCYVRIIRYADDIVLLANDIVAITRGIEATENFLAVRGLKLSASKTKIQT